jgi:hypothetical protein
MRILPLWPPRSNWTAPAITRASAFTANLSQSLFFLPVHYSSTGQTIRAQAVAEQSLADRFAQGAFPFAPIRISQRGSAFWTHSRRAVHIALPVLKARTGL